VIHYRTFRNPDPPLVSDVWNASLAGPRTVLIPPRATGLLEACTFAKLYFDPEGLTLALDDDRPVGLVHAGFGGADGYAVNRTTGVVCTLGVLPSHRRQGIGTELLRRAEDYLRQKGAQEVLAGPAAPANPFTFGLYGGCDSVGFLASDGLARPFFEGRGYRVARTLGVFRRSLKRLTAPADPRFLGIVQGYEILGAPLSRAGWWRECVLGPVEAVEYRLQPKGQPVADARIALWDMAPFSFGWGETCVGLLDLEVRPECRRQGLGKFLLTQVLFHLQQQTFDLFEARADLDNQPAVGLLRSLGFEQVDTGHTFRRE
jgi:ribosomal protein S18 acetylase RimI-like enzyme